MRVIDRLRAAYPGEQWVYLRCPHAWHAVSGRMLVVAESWPAPRFDGDDDTFRKVYIDSASGCEVLSGLFSFARSHGALVVEGETP